MKKILMLICLSLLFCGNAYCANGDIAQTEVRPDVASWKLDTVTFRVFTKTCTVSYRKVDSNGNPVGLDKFVILQDIADDPGTPDDETMTEFTDLIASINAGNSIKSSVTNAVKAKLGI